MTHGSRVLGSEPNLIDLSPSLLSIMGSSLNFNNNGVLRPELLSAFGLKELPHQAFLLFSNARQLLQFFITITESLFFRDEILHGHADELNADFEFIRDFYLTYLMDGTHPETGARLAKLEKHCRNF